ncbi:hypothetical protein BH24GEM3_BH24GEM3_20060 [soil metagenome]|jgi:hypothetical protein|nr:hypothetical protein [Gemmatimonadota bacterium]
MAYALIHFLEGSDPRVTLVRAANGQPTGNEGVMNLLGAFINEWSPTVVREGSPGAVRMAMLFVAQEEEAGREVRVLGGEGPLGITAEEVKALEGQGFFYEVSFGHTGERTLPMVRSHAIERPDAAQ